MCGVLTCGLGSEPLVFPLCRPVMRWGGQNLLKGQCHGGWLSQPMVLDVHSLQRINPGYGASAGGRLQFLELLVRGEGLLTGRRGSCEQEGIGMWLYHSL